MSSSRKLRTAHFLMFIGIAPLAFGLFLAIVGIASSIGHVSPGGANDAFLMIAILFFGYLMTMVFGVAGLTWSWILTSRGIDRRTTATLVLRILVIGTLVLIPLLCLAPIGYFEWRTH